MQEQGSKKKKKKYSRQHVRDSGPRHTCLNRQENIIAPDMKNQSLLSFKNVEFIVK